MFFSFRYPEKEHEGHIPLHTTLIQSPAFQKVLEQQSTERAPNYRIASEKHEIFTVGTIKVCLSAYDDKRFIFDDGITSLPFGHYKIVNDVFMREILDNWEVNMDNTNISEGAETTLGNDDERPEILSLNSSMLGDRSDNSFKETDWGFLQRTYNESELEVNSCEVSEEPRTPSHNEFILFEAEESDEETPVAPHKRARRASLYEFSADSN